jgi:hypothetical protein
MKKIYQSMWIMSVLFYSLVNVVCAENEHDFAKEEEMYQLAVRNALSEKIAQKRKTIQERPRQQLLWKVANIIGPLGLMTLALYQWLKPASTIIEYPIAERTQNNLPLVEPLPMTQQETSHQTEQQYLELFVPVVQENKPLIKEDVSKYTQASKAYGAAAVWFTLNALFDPFFYPYVAATYIGSLYYGVKELQQH